MVEDEALLRHHLTTRLSELGHNIDALADAEEALYQAREYHHDLAIVDLGLPGMSGLDSIRELRNQGMSLPILILTSAAAGRIRWKGYRPVPTTTLSNLSIRRIRGAFTSPAAPFGRRHAEQRAVW